MERVADIGTVEKQQILHYAHNREPGASSHLVVLFPGIGSNMRGKDNIMRRIKTRHFPSLHYDSITASFSETPFDLDDVIREFASVLNHVQTEFGITNIVFLGSSVGAGYAVRLAQYLYKNPDPKLKIDALILLMPCINQENIRGNVIGILKRLPPFMALGVMQMAYAVKHVIGHIVSDPFETSGSISTRYASFLTIPERSTDPIDPITSVHVFLSENDLYINNKTVIEDLEGSIAKKNTIKIQCVSPTGVNNHNFKPGEWMNAAQTHFLPILAGVWKQVLV